jgi:signal peptidase II
MRSFYRLKVHRFFVMGFILFTTIGCDQVSKIAAKDLLMHAGPVSYWGDLFRFQYSENVGAFLSMGSSLPENIRFWIFTVAVGIALMTALCYLLFSQLSLAVTLGLTLVVGGGLGNLFDRIFNGKVVDFMNAGIGNLRTGIFNVADVAIVVGMVVLLFAPWLNKKMGARSLVTKEGRT